MSDFASLVEFYENRGFSGKEAIEKAEAREREERAEAREERACEFYYCYFILFLFHNRFF